MVQRSKARTQSASFQGSPFRLSLFTSSLEWTFSVRLSSMIPQWFPSPVPFSRAKTAKIATPMVPKTYGTSDERILQPPPESWCAFFLEPVCSTRSHSVLRYPRKLGFPSSWPARWSEPPLWSWNFRLQSWRNFASQLSSPTRSENCALYCFFTTWSVSIKKPETVLCNVYLCHFVLSQANYHGVCFCRCGLTMWAATT